MVCAIQSFLICWCFVAFAGGFEKNAVVKVWFLDG
jgi:hypothetical protein